MGVNPNIFARPVRTALYFWLNTSVVLAALVKKPTTAELTALRRKFGKDLGNYDLTRHYTLSSPSKAGVLNGLAVPKGGLQALLLITGPKTGSIQFSIVQEESQRSAGVDGVRIVGGSTFVVRKQSLK